MKWEKELIAKIQISQLVPEDPFKEDFYYQIYTTLVNNSTTPASTPAGGLPPALEGESLLRDRRGGRQNRRSVTNRMQQQMQRLIEKRKQKTKGSSLTLEGALGKIALTSAKNPRQILSFENMSIISAVGLFSYLFNFQFVNVKFYFFDILLCRMLRNRISHSRLKVYFSQLKSSMILS